MYRKCPNKTKFIFFLWKSDVANFVQELIRCRVVRRQTRAAPPPWWRIRSWQWVLLVLVLVAGAWLLGRHQLGATRGGQQVRSALYFALGWHHIAQQQRQLRHTVEAVVRETGLTGEAYQAESLRDQRRGRESWQLWRHRIALPTPISLTIFETRLRQAIRSTAHTVLVRRTREQASETTVVLTVGVAHAPTDLFVLFQNRAPWVRMPPQVSAPPILPQMAIVIDDMGWNLDMAQALLALDIPLSFAILPQSPHQTRIMEEAQQHGRDVLLHMPMEPHGYPQVNPGKAALLRDMSSRDLRAHLRAALQALPRVIGVNNHMGSRLTEDAQAMRVVMQALKQQDLFFLDSRTSADSQAYDMARELGVRTAQRHVFLDHDVDLEQIMRQIRHLAALAHTQGHAIGIGHPYPETLRALKQTLPALRQAGIRMVPVSHLVR